MSDDSKKELKLSCAPAPPLSQVAVGIFLFIPISPNSDHGLLSGILSFLAVAYRCVD